MENKIKENLHNPKELESIYQQNKKSFRETFNNIYEDIKESDIASFWKARLDYQPSNIAKQTNRTSLIIYLLISCLFTFMVVKLPTLVNLNGYETDFYNRNSALAILAGLAIFLFTTKKNVKITHVIISLAIFIISAAHINLLPVDYTSQTLTLSYFHIPLFLWCVLGLIFIDFNSKGLRERISFIKFNGDLLILSTLILIAGAILAGITFGLFEAIDLAIEKFYGEYVIIAGLVSAPIVAAYILKINPTITNKIAHVIANIFSPLVLITLIIYLGSIVITGKDPYRDRDFLLIFNLLLIGVMAIIVFSISERSSKKKQRFNASVLLALAAFTLLIDGIALSAILYRLGEYGFTPNRIVVLGSNLLIFANLTLIIIDLYLVSRRKKKIENVELRIAKFLPIYSAWTLFVSFVLPFIFWFK
jgi:hypothetical protein